MAVRFSFIIPFHDCARYLERAIRSVLEQELDDWELILVNDGSGDESAAIARRHAGDSNRVRLLEQENRGPGAARNAGARMARGQWLWFLDCDDELLRGATKEVESCILEHPDAEVLVGGYYLSDLRRRTRRYPPSFSSDRERNFRDFIGRRMGSIPHGAILVRRALFGRFEYPEQVRNNEDLVFHAQLLANCNCVSLEPPLVTIHRRPDSLRHAVEPEEVPERVTALLFDAGKLRPRLISLRHRFLTSRRLSRFRRLYRAGCYSAARKAYLDIVRDSPAALLQWSYLKKFLRALFRRDRARS